MFLWVDHAWNRQGNGEFCSWIDPYLIQTGVPVGAILICPGGAYAGQSFHEGEPVARQFNRNGFHAFVLHYRVSPFRHPAPLHDIARAMRIIRWHASAWKIKPDKIATCGFSAGGHLAGSLGIYFDRGDPQAEYLVERLSCKPDALILCYPVITTGNFANKTSFANLLGNNVSSSVLRQMSLELLVRSDTPPTFLWHTVDDEGVSVENSLLFAQALRKYGIPFEAHLYPHGGHGGGLSLSDKHVATWMSLCCQWLRKMDW
ncbi:MAG: hypothetical protein A2Y12_09755 [Planctomycetes bacterium GWF2_42_9]|nr:MAG: hypothetical protein A2Y12_09755 [Planctomycetes bacterium GWF2_42_9]